MTRRKPTNHNKCPKPHKRKYATQQDADEALGKEWREGRRKHMPIRAYLCVCGQWHTTSKPLWPTAA